MPDIRVVGEFGEELAINHLKKNGYSILAKNYRIGHKEIDIIAGIGQKIVFLEVKTRIGNDLAMAEDSYGRFKNRLFKSAIKIYLSKHNISPDRMRADLILVCVDRIRKVAKIRHYQDII